MRRRETASHEETASASLGTEAAETLAKSGGSVPNSERSPAQACRRSILPQTGVGDINAIAKLSEPVVAPVPNGSAPFYFAIPSYDRSGTVGQKTLGLLERHGVLLDAIYVFVANECERQRYAMQLGDRCHLVVGVFTLWKQRNLITRYFPEGSHVVSLDDDVEELYRLEDDGETLQPLHLGGLQDIIHEARRLMQRTGAHLWSLNVSDNPMYMKRAKVTQRLGLCNGFFWGCIVRHDSRLRLQHGDGHEDVERTVRYFDLDGVVIRFREFCAKTRCKTNEGGLQTSLPKEQRRKAEDEGVQLLTREFPIWLEAQEGSILGLKFRSGVSSMLRKHSVLGCAGLSRVVALRQLASLAGSRWVFAVPGKASKAGKESPCPQRAWLATGKVEVAGHDPAAFILSGDDGGGKLIASARAVHEALRQERFVLVWMPPEACSALGRQACAPLDAVPCFLRGLGLQGRRVDALTVVAPDNVGVAMDEREPASDFARYLQGVGQSSLDDGDALGEEDEALPDWKQGSDASDGRTAAATGSTEVRTVVSTQVSTAGSAAAPKRNSSGSKCGNATEAAPDVKDISKAARKGVGKYEDPDWIQAQRAGYAAAESPAVPTASTAALDILSDWAFNTDNETAMQRLAEEEAAAGARGAGQGAVRDPFFCAARIWGGGWGAQCTYVKAEHDKEYCGTHRRELSRQEYLTHGRIDGEIPPKKREEFAQFQKKLLKLEALPLSSASTLTDAGPHFDAATWRARGRSSSESQRAYEYRTGNLSAAGKSENKAPPPQARLASSTPARLSPLASSPSAPTPPPRIPPSSPSWRPARARAAAASGLGTDLLARACAAWAAAERQRSLAAVTVSAAVVAGQLPRPLLPAVSSSQDIRSCPSGHAMTVFQTQENGFRCNVCGNRLPLGALTHACRRCDWDVCDDCTWKEARAKPHGRPPQKGLDGAGAEEPKPKRSRKMPPSQ